MIGDTGRSAVPRNRSRREVRRQGGRPAPMSNPIEMEWQALRIWRSMPRLRRSPTFRPLASTTSRAEIGLAVGQRELLPLGAGRDIGHLGVDELGGGCGFRRGSPRDQRVCMMPYCRLGFLSRQIAESRDPVFAVMGGRTQHRIGDSGLEESCRAACRRSIFDARSRMDRSRCGSIRTSRNTRRGRALRPRSSRQASADNRNVGVPHAESQPGCDILHPKGKQRLIPAAHIRPDPGIVFQVVFTRVK